MIGTTVRISEASHQLLRELAKGSGESMQAILDRALEDYRRKRFLEECNAAYGALRANPEAWADVEGERRRLEGTLMDGLDSEERWSADGKALPTAPAGKRSKKR